MKPFWGLSSKNFISLLTPLLSSTYFTNNLRHIGNFCFESTENHIGHFSGSKYRKPQNTCQEGHKKESALCVFPVTPKNGFVISRVQTWHFIKAPTTVLTIYLSPLDSGIKITTKVHRSICSKLRKFSCWAEQRSCENKAVASPVFLERVLGSQSDIPPKSQPSDHPFLHLMQYHRHLRLMHYHKYKQLNQVFGNMFIYTMWRHHYSFCCTEI